MYRTMLTLMFTSTLTLATLCDAGPRQPTLVPTASSLSQIEEMCRIVGNTAHTSAKMRDTGLSYLEAVQLMREVTAKHPLGGAWGIWFNTSILGNLRWVYEHPAFSPRQIRNETELACLRIAEDNGITSTTVIK